LGIPKESSSRAVGIISAISELSVVALYFTTWPLLSVGQVAVGVGAGSAEAAYLLGLGVFGPRPPPDQIAAWARGAESSLCVRYRVPIERLFALIGHIGARGLVYIGLHTSLVGGVTWISVALLLFTAIDGVAVYGHLQQWKWEDPPVCRRAHLYFASVSLVEALLYIICVRVTHPG
jgi:hypothetical protein